MSNQRITVVSPHMVLLEIPSNHATHVQVSKSECAQINPEPWESTTILFR